MRRHLPPLAAAPISNDPKHGGNHRIVRCVGRSHPGLARRISAVSSKCHRPVSSRNDLRRTPSASPAHFERRGDSVREQTSEDFSEQLGCRSFFKVWMRSSERAGPPHFFRLEFSPLRRRGRKLPHRGRTFRVPNLRFPGRRGIRSTRRKTGEGLSNQAFVYTSSSPSREERPRGRERQTSREVESSIKSPAGRFPAPATRIPEQNKTAKLGLSECLSSGQCIHLSWIRSSEISAPTVVAATTTSLPASEAGAATTTQCRSFRDHPLVCVLHPPTQPARPAVIYVLISRLFLALASVTERKQSG